MIAVLSFKSTVLSKTGRFPFVMVPVRETIRFGFSNVALASFASPSPASVGIIEKSKSSSFRFCSCGVDCKPLTALTRVGETECVLSLDLLRCEPDRIGLVAICFGGEAGRVGEPPES